MQKRGEKIGRKEPMNKPYAEQICFGFYIALQSNSDFKK
jgi:hypothetical protein